ncbi:n-alpha-acetyltransferase 60 [Caerostris darwini]|uniref:N-alpha-acetyltransferase 60 n=1 Tax=Caerostris darwini TaxID=1538125 RepID=A0AAV4X389_9ARAC|nr:n-alpha-acetyltransferase 60 [Caerostris darwini]
MSKQVPLCNDSNVQLRFLGPEDVPAVKKLCTEWFPIEYPDSWYKDITSSNKFFSLAAVYRVQIIGLVVAEIKAQSQCNKEDQGLLSSNFTKNTKVAYILTLGVVEDFRRNGIGFLNFILATLLLNSLVDHLTKNPDGNSCKAVYLHVLTSNTTAIQFYEQRNFTLHSFLPLYYSVHGVAKDGYSYVLYINGGHPPWTFVDYLKQWGQFISHFQVCILPKRVYRLMQGFVTKLWPENWRSR